MSTRCAVLGSPIEHSLSPVLHRTAYAEMGLDWSYHAIRVEEDALADFVAGLGPEWRGLSLTMPLKRAVMTLLDSVDSWAAKAGAANTVVLDEGRLAGANTDVPGAVAALRRAGVDALRSVAVLGGGATAASLALAAAELGCRRTTLWVRDPARAADTVAVVSAAAPDVAVEVRSLHEAPSLGGVDAVLSTIPAAAQDETLAAVVAEAPVVFEALYDPWPTPFAIAATGRLVGGLDLLVEQAALQVRLMTGRDDVPVEEMRSAGERALAR